MYSGGKQASPDREKAKRESHKQIERRRRETINNYISQLAAIVPGGEKVLPSNLGNEV
jgi:Helix-loop-helix DNA-binding domain